MTSNRPYLIRALYEWISDNGLTPYILVDALAPGAEVPEGYVENGRIILNIAPRAVSHLELTNDAVIFEARFGGQPMRIYVPIKAVMAIYAQENGQGMFFGDEPEDEMDHSIAGLGGQADKGEQIPMQQARDESPSEHHGKAMFSVVDGGGQAPESIKPDSKKPNRKKPDSKKPESDPDDDDPGPAGPSGKKSSSPRKGKTAKSVKRPSLRVIK